MLTLIHDRSGGTSKGGRGIFKGSGGIFKDGGHTSKGDGRTSKRGGIYLLLDLNWSSLHEFLQSRSSARRGL